MQMRTKQISKNTNDFIQKKKNSRTTHRNAQIRLALAYTYKRCYRSFTLVFIHIKLWLASFTKFPLCASLFLCYCSISDCSQMHKSYLKIMLLGWFTLPTSTLLRINAYFPLHLPGVCCSQFAFISVQHKCRV